MADHDAWRGNEAPRSAFVVGLIVLALAVMFGPSVASHARESADPWAFTDDARQDVWPTFRYRDASLFPNDYIADYYLGFNPKGFTQLYRLGARWIDPRTISRVLPYLLMVATLAGAGVAAWTTAGPVAAWTAMALCLSSDLFLGRMMGGLPRAFGLPAVALLAAGLALRRPGLMVAATLLGAAFYYPGAVVGGITLALFLLLPPRCGGQGRSWSWTRRIATLAGTGVATLLIALPSMIAVRSYGAGLGPADWGEWPESGMGGRFWDQPIGVVSWADFGPPLWQTAQESLLNFSRPWLGFDFDRGLLCALAFGVAAVGYARLITGQAAAHGATTGQAAADGLTTRRAAARTLLLLLPAMALAYFLVCAAMPYLYRPERYLRLVLPIFSVVAVPTGICALWLHADPRRRQGGGLASCALVLLLLGGSWSRDLGLDHVPSRDRPLHGFLSALPANALIAGWPTEMNDVPLISRRSALLTFETHLPYHEEYTREMRRRMAALIGAYFATDSEPIERLRDDFGVTHLLVDRLHFIGKKKGGTRPTYFKPFDQQIRAARAQSRNRPRSLELSEDAAVFDENGFLVLALDRIGSEDPR